MERADEPAGIWALTPIAAPKRVAKTATQTIERGKFTTIYSSFSLEQFSEPAWNRFHSQAHSVALTKREVVWAFLRPQRLKGECQRSPPEATTRFYGVSNNPLLLRKSKTL